MNAPGSPGRRSHDQEDRRPDPQPPRQPEPPAGSDARQGAETGPDPRSVPSTPAELVAIQRRLDPSHEAAPHGEESRVERALALLSAQDLSPWESQQIALALLQQLESYHQGVVREMHDAPQSTPAQVACWAIDGDRLMHCRRLLESITLI